MGVSFLLVPPGESEAILGEYRNMRNNLLGYPYFLIPVVR